MAIGKAIVDVPSFLTIFGVADVGDSLSLNLQEPVWRNYEL